jgi:hypothetical protein
LRLGRLGVPAAMARPPLGAGPGGRSGHGDGRQFGQGHRGLVGVGGGEDDTDPAAQLVEADPAGRVVLAQHRGQSVAVGVPDQRPRRAGCVPGRRGRHAQADGVTTTAVP